MPPVSCDRVSSAALAFCDSSLSSPKSNPMEYTTGPPRFCTRRMACSRVIRDALSAPSVIISTTCFGCFAWFASSSAEATTASYRAVVLLESKCESPRSSASMFEVNF